MLQCWSIILIDHVDIILSTVCNQLTLKQYCCSPSMHLSLHHFLSATVSLGLRNYKQTLTWIYFKS